MTAPIQATDANEADIASADDVRTIYVIISEHIARIKQSQWKATGSGAAVYGALALLHREITQKLSWADELVLPFVALTLICTCAAVFSAQRDLRVQRQMLWKTRSMLSIKGQSIYPAGRTKTRRRDYPFLIPMLLVQFGGAFLVAATVVLT